VTLEPDIAVLDVNLPEMNGQQITHQVNQEKLPTRILLLTGYDDIEQAIHAAHAGAAAYCTKDIHPQGLVSVIREVANGKYVIGGNVFTRRELDEWLESQMEGARRSYSEPGSPFPSAFRPRDGSIILCGSWYEQ
jgi:DNA-binding NarL/FixJ family response regulator